MTVVTIPKIRIRHNKRRQLIQKLRSPDTDWSRSYDNSSGPRMEDPVMQRWIVGIYGRLVGWNDMSKLGSGPYIYDEPLLRVYELNTHLALCLESSDDRLGTYYALTLHARKYVEPSAIPPESKAEVDQLLESLLSPDTAAQLHEADALVTWHMEGGLAGIYAALSGLEHMMREPGDARERIVRDQCYAWINHQKSYMDT